MNDEYLYDIADVCQKLNITSRTLRFYEEKRIIESTKDGLSYRRKYTTQQIDNISKVVTLRTLGLSIKAIQELKGNGDKLKEYMPKDVFCAIRKDTLKPLGDFVSFQSRYKVNSNMEIEEISIWSEYNIPKYVRIDKKRIAYTNNGESPSL